MGPFRKWVPRVRQNMTPIPFDYSKAMVLLIGFPVGNSVQALANRLFLKPYPPNAWGSWLCVGWAAMLIVMVIQFALGTIAHSGPMKGSFLKVGLNAVLYAFVLLSLVNTLFPEPPHAIPHGFLLTQFCKSYQYIYAYAFVLAFLPFIIGSSVFGNKLISVPQISRIIWMTCSVIGFVVPVTYIGVHEAICVIAFPLLVLLFLLYASVANSKMDGVVRKSSPVQERIAEAGQPEPQLDVTAGAVPHG